MEEMTLVVLVATLLELLFDTTVELVNLWSDLGFGDCKNYDVT